MQWNTYLLVIAIAVLYIWFKSKTGKANQSATGSGRQTKASAKPAPSGKFAFQESGTEPQADSEGRVIVKLKSAANGLAFGVNIKHLEPELASKLAGKIKEDEEFSKSVKARVRPDEKSEYSDSFIIETLDGKLIGWILKAEAEEATSVFGQLDSAVRQSAPELGTTELTFEVSVRIEGYWNEVSEEGQPEEWDPDFEVMEIRIKVPVEVEVE